ncbi:MAG: hypothetical protein HC896_13795 [Bacteroidales bacterium]|nr:hypothetical protein [Bacteroidales bacterium]
MVVKTIEYNTTMPAGTRGNWWIGIPINLYEICPGIDASIFKQPVAKVEFDPKKKEYNANKEHDNSMRARIREFEARNDKCLDEEYIDMVRQADQFLKQDQLDEAQDLYLLATEKRPWEIYPKEQLDKVEALIAKRGVTDKVYDATIDKANEQFNEGDYLAAKTTYKRAQMLKPGDTNPGKKIAEIDRLMATKVQATQSELAVETQFQQLVNDANKAFQAANYQQAKGLYELALSKKPTDAGIRSRLNSVNQLIDQQAGKQAEQKQQDEAYQLALNEANKLFAQQNFAEARFAYLKASGIKPTEQLPRDKVKAIDEQLENQRTQEELKAKQDQEQRFNQLVSQAEQLESKNDLSAALQTYNEALIIKPFDAYVKARFPR